MDYRLMDATASSLSAQDWGYAVHPSHAADIVREVTESHGSLFHQIENLDAHGRPSDLADRVREGELILIDPSGTSPPAPAGFKGSLGGAGGVGRSAAQSTTSQSTASDSLHAAKPPPYQAPARVRRRHRAQWRYAIHGWTGVP